MKGKRWGEENKFLSGEEDGRWFLCSFWITGEEEYISFSSENGQVLHVERLDVIRKERDW